MSADTGERWMPQTERDLLVRAALEEVQSFTDATDRMHSGLRGDMDMNASDLAALRMLVMRERTGEHVKPNDIAQHLAISTASTTKLLDRLTASGHLRREPHPHDRRARVVVLTDRARVEFFQLFGRRVRRMREAMGAYDDAELRTIIRFLSEMADAMLAAEREVAAEPAVGQAEPA
jgi:DNA-binding MarR family transcriptional regulator